MHFDKGKEIREDHDDRWIHEFRFEDLLAFETLIEISFGIVRYVLSVIKFLICVFLSLRGINEKLSG